MKNKKPEAMIKELEKLVQEAKEICEKILSKPKESINGKQLPETARVAKKAG